MHPFKTIAIAVLAWPVAELVAFVFVAATVGVLEAIVLIVLTSLLGLFVLRHFGGGAQRLRDDRGVFVATVFGEGSGPVLAGILLLIPGFVSSAAGVLVLLPPTRRLLIAVLQRFMAAGGPSQGARPVPGVIDLAPEEWQPLPGETLPPSPTDPEQALPSGRHSSSKPPSGDGRPAR